MINEIIPRLRSDLKYNPIEQNGIILYVVYDEIGLISQPVAFQENELIILKLINGNSSIENILITLNNPKITSYDLINFINLLAESNFLETPDVLNSIESIKQYLRSEIKPAVCAGTTYPNDPYDLRKYLDHILNSSPKSNEKYNAIIAPHLDYRTGLNTHKTYAKAFNSLDTEDVELIILFGTAHYRSSNDFMFTKKNYKTPLGKIQTDKEFLKLLENNSKSDIFYDDLAHINEHSLELHILLLQHILNNKNIKIVPILTGSTYNYFQTDKTPNSNLKYNEFINTFQTTINQYNKKTLFLASGDLCHIGQKFGDEVDAINMEQEINEFDNELISKIQSNDNNQFFKFVNSQFESKRVCGTFPFYVLNDLLSPTQIDKLHYNYWYEKETKSAVSICSLGLKF